MLQQNQHAVNPARPTSHTQLYGNPITVAGRVSGFYMERTREYYRKVDGSRHFLRKPAVITNDVAALAEAERLGADRVRIVDSETGNEYTCAIAVIRDYGFPVDRGYGRQIALPFGYWIQTAADGTITAPTLPQQPQPQTQPVAQQCALFDMPAERKGGY
jgi:hypothetical protein